MTLSPKLRLVTEYGQLTAPPKPATISSILPAEYPRAAVYRPYMTAEQHEETLHTLQLFVWRDGRDFDVWGMPYAGMTVWDLTGSGLIFNCYNYRVEIEGRGLNEDWRFREALGKHRLKSICEWNAAVHKRPPARVGCVSRISRVEDL